MFRIDSCELCCQGQCVGNGMVWCVSGYTFVALVQKKFASSGDRYPESSNLRTQTKRHDMLAGQAEKRI